METAFKSLIQDYVLVYLDDVTIFSKNKNYQITHLRKVFIICSRFGIPLNPKKTIFAINEGEILGFIISKHGKKIRPKRTEAIVKIPPLHNKKSMQSFLRKINFVRIFLPSFVETVKPLKDMIKINEKFQWRPKEKDSFDRIKI
jgi:hypothetical protein